MLKKTTKTVYSLLLGKVKVILLCNWILNQKLILYIQNLSNERNNNIFILSVLADLVENFRDFVVW